MFRALPLLLLVGCQFGLLSNRGGKVAPKASFNACLAPTGLRATGTWDDPVVIAEVPFVDAADTTDAPADEADAWDCDQARDRSAGEVVYKLDWTAERDLRVELTAADGAALMVQLLPASATLAGGQVTGCVSASDDVMQSDSLNGGTWYLVVDTLRTPQGEALPGAYTLTVEDVTRGEWVDVELGEGLTWRRQRGAVGEHTSFNAFVVDLAARDVQPRAHESCETVATRGTDLGARAGVSGGFAGTACESLDMVRADGVTFSTNAYADRQRVVAWDDGAAPVMAWIDRGEDVTEAANAFGSYPSLIASGLVTIEPAGTGDLYDTPQARVAAGITPNDQLVLLVADGGTNDATGLALDDLAAKMAELGAVEAVNLAGAESATAWVEGCSGTGVVSYPTAGGGSVHDGAATLPDGIYVF